MKKFITFLLALIFIFALAGCSSDDSSVDDQTETVDDGTTVFHLDADYTTDTLLVEQAQITEVGEEEIVRVYEEDFKDSGYAECLIRFTDDDNLGVYMTEDLVEVYCKVVDGQYDGPAEDAVQYTIKDGELVEKADNDILNLTTAQENAYASARAYLTTGDFSKKGLIRQLVDAEQFKLKDARFAVNFIQKRGEVNWKEEAVGAAQSYLDSGSFSKDGLYDQLVSDAEQFTPKQARYAANKVYK